MITACVNLLVLSTNTKNTEIAIAAMSPITAVPRVTPHA